MLRNLAAQGLRRGIVEGQAKEAARLRAALCEVQYPVDDRLGLAGAGRGDQPDGLVRRIDQGKLVIVRRRLERLEGGAGVEVGFGQPPLKLLLQFVPDVKILELVVKRDGCSEVGD